MDPNVKPIVLLAEDEPADVFMMQRAIRKFGWPVELHVVSNGEEAIDYISGEGSYVDRERFPMPQLILLDIKMPRKSGLEVLEWLKEHGGFPKIPVVMVTSSSVTSDVEQAYALGASGYLVKPVPADQLENLFTRTEEFLSEHGPEMRQECVGAVLLGDQGRVIRKRT